MQKTFYLLLTFVIFPAFAQAVPLDDPHKSVEAVDQMLSEWTFEDAFHQGDVASLYQNYCRSVEGKWRCSLLPSTRSVISVSDQEAVVETRFEGAPARQISITRDDFEKSKNFLKYFFATLECKSFDKDGNQIPCPAVAAEPTQRSDTLSDGKTFSGLDIEFTLMDSLKGRMFLGRGVPWVARLIMLTMPGAVVPDEILLGYERKQ